MSSKLSSHRVFFAFALLTAFVLASLPVQARPVRRPAADRQAVAVAGDSGLNALWRFVVGLWPGVTAKEGVTIDPDGAHNHASKTNDEGVTIDPNGSR